MGGAGLSLRVGPNAGARKGGGKAGPCPRDSLILTFRGERGSHGEKGSAWEGAGLRCKWLLQLPEPLNFQNRVSKGRGGRAPQEPRTCVRRRFEVSKSRKGKKADGRRYL